MKSSLMLSLVLWCWSSLTLAQNSGLNAEVPNLAEPQVGLYTAGQPSAKAWALLAQDGVTTVINLRSDAEMQGSQEPSLVRANGMNYVQIAVAGAGDINAENAALLRQAINAAEGKVLVHCASSNRVGALLAIDAATTNSVADSIHYGKVAGLTSLEPVVRGVLGAAK